MNLTVDRRKGSGWRAMPWTLVTAICLGIFFAPGAGLDWAYDTYDTFKPVVVTEGKLVSLDLSAKPPTATVVIEGSKNRACQYLAIRAYALRDGLLFDINLQRIDRPSFNVTHPVGKLNFGTWSLWPVEGTKMVRIFFYHSCDGRLVVTKAADITLTD